ncbi:MAG: O-antigen ligase family protein [Terriglobales bacterium]
MRARPEVSPASPRRKAQAMEEVLFYGLVALLVFGPLAFGAVEEWSVFVLRVTAILLVVLWAGLRAFAGRLTVIDNPLYLPMIAFALIVGTQYLFGLTAYGYATHEEALNYVAYGALMFVAAQVLHTPGALRRFTIILSVVGFAIALFAIVQDFTSNGRIYWVRVPRFGGWIAGPYVNHNHYAGLMEMLIPMPLALGFHRSNLRSRSALLFFMATIMAASIFISQSRAGVMAFIIEMVLFGTMIFLRNRRRSIVIVAVLLVTVAFLGWLNTTQVFTRMQETHDLFRAHILRDGLVMFRQKPILGWGFGTFPTVYPSFRSFYTNLFVNQAHNDILQVLVETGALGFGVMIWFLVLVYRRGLSRGSSWDSRPGGLPQLAALVGVSGIVVHSFFDFNLHIPANAALFYVLCVVAAEHVDGRTLSIRTARPRPALVVDES